MTRRFLTVTNPLCTVAVFMMPDGAAQAVLTSDRHIEFGKVDIPAPPEGERLVIKRMPDGSVDVIYETAEG